MKKRGQMFSLIAILLVVLLATTFGIYSIFSDRQPIKTRIETMDSFVFSMEENLERQLYTTGFRTIFLAENEIVKNGDYISNLDSFFNEATLNGTVNGESQDIMQGATLNDMINSTQEKADKMNLDIVLSNVELNLTQEDPWNVAIILTGNLNLSDKTQLARWDKALTIKSYIDIKNFEDPLFLVETNGKIPRFFNRTPYENNFVSISDVTNLTLHLERGYYVENNESPSFLNRLEGNLNSNEFGVESLVDISELTSQSLQIKDKSIVDHIYFSTENPLNYQVTNMPSWFKIDTNHLEKYQVENISY